LKTLLTAVVLSFILSPSALLRRNAAWLAERSAAKAEFSAKLLLAELPEGMKSAGNNLQAKLSIDANAQGCVLSMPSLEGGLLKEYTWKRGVISKTQEGGPEVEALLVGICGLWAAGGGGGETRLALERFLTSLGINLKVSELSLLEREVVYALGEAGERSPQYWISKEDYAARGLRWVDAGGALWELRLKKGEKLLEAMELWREGRLALRVWTEAPKPPRK